MGKDAAKTEHFSFSVGEYRPPFVLKKKWNIPTKIDFANNILVGFYQTWRQEAATRDEAKRSSVEQHTLPIYSLSSGSATPTTQGAPAYRGQRSKQHGERSTDLHELRLSGTTNRFASSVKEEIP